MIVMTRDPGTPAEFMLADFLTLETPEGYRAELTDGEIVVTAWVRLDRDDPPVEILSHVDFTETPA